MELFSECQGGSFEVEYEPERNRRRAGWTYVRPGCDFAGIGVGL